MPLTDDYRLQDIFSRARTAQARLNLVSIAIFREAHLLDVNEWHETTQLTYTIDGYDRCRQLKLPSMPSHERKFYHPDEFRPWPMPRYTSYECGTEWQVGWCSSSGVEIRRNWGPRLGSGGKGSIQFRNSGLEVSYQLGVPFFCFTFLFSSLSLCHTSLLLWVSAPYKWHRHGFYHLPISVNGSWSFPVRQILRKVTLSGTDRLWDLWVRTIAYVGWLFHSLFPFSSPLWYRLWQPRRSAPKEGDNVTAARDPGLGNGHSV